MRADMKKVLTERPRSLGRDRYKHHRTRLKREIGTDTESSRQMIRPYRNRKAFTGLIGPLRRFLEGQVGRPWNDVWSEICESVDGNSVQDQHLRRHAIDMVEREVVMIDGVPHRTRSFRQRGPVELDGLYIDPDTGLIGRHHRKRQTRAKQPVTRIDFEPGRCFVQLDGIWYWVRYDTIPEHLFFGRIEDILRKNRVCRIGTVEVVTEKRQLNRKELNRHGLKNVSK